MRRQDRRESNVATLHPAHWSIERYQAFWAKPDLSLVKHALTDDIVGYWPGSPEPVRGLEPYTARIAQVLELLPDLTLKVLEHAQNGDIVFIRWIAHATGASGDRAQLIGVDRLRLRDGLVAENVIHYDPAEFEKLLA
ncbi:MAG: nuclear transport factor 2 family protein [Lysobacterales bacterium]